MRLFFNFCFDADSFSLLSAFDSFEILPEFLGEDDAVAIYSTDPFASHPVIDANAGLFGGPLRPVYDLSANAFVHPSPGYYGVSVSPALKQGHGIDANTGLFGGPLRPVYDLNANAFVHPAPGNPDVSLLPPYEPSGDFTLPRGPPYPFYDPNSDAFVNPAPGYPGIPPLPELNQGQDRPPWWNNETNRPETPVPELKERTRLTRTDKWDANLQAVRDFIARHGKEPMRRAQDKVEKYLGVWMMTQRTDKSKLTQERRDKWVEAGLGWKKERDFESEAFHEAQERRAETRRTQRRNESGGAIIVQLCNEREVALKSAFKVSAAGELKKKRVGCNQCKRLHSANWTWRYPPGITQSDLSASFIMLFGVEPPTPPAATDSA
jgi:hypothetical protein